MVSAWVFCLMTVPVIQHVALGCYSNFSFLTGAAHPAEMVETAATLGWQAIGLADINSYSGIVRAHIAARDAAIQLVVGVRVRPVDGPDILVHPCDRQAYEDLSVSYVERIYNIKQWTDMPKGGHFAALEQPELLVNDIRKFSNSLK